MVRFAGLLLLCQTLFGWDGQNVLLVINDADRPSQQIGGYYRDRREIPTRNVCSINTPPLEEVARDVYLKDVEEPIAACLKKNGLTESVLYIVTTMGVPLKISGRFRGNAAEYAAVDSELALLYSKMKGAVHPIGGWVPNPFFGNRDAPFRHPNFPIYLVTRLAGFEVTDVLLMINRSLAARNEGKFVIDAGSTAGGDGNAWLRNAALIIPKSRTILDVEPKILYDMKDVIAYAGWGSNDGERKKRNLGYTWLPGAIVDEFVSTNARTFKRPPDDWNVSAADYAGSTQDLLADYLHEGATAAPETSTSRSCGAAPAPTTFPGIFEGRNLAEASIWGCPT